MRLAWGADLASGFHATSIKHRGWWIDPHPGGERSPIFARQARGLILGLTLSHARAHVHRALLEGVAYALKHHLELMAEVDIAPASSHCARWWQSKRVVDSNRQRRHG